MELQIQGLHHFAWRCRDTQVARAPYEELLGLPLVHVIRSDHVPSTGQYCLYVHIIFRMREASHMARRHGGGDRMRRGTLARTAARIGESQDKAARGVGVW